MVLVVLFILLVIISIILFLLEYNDENIKKDKVVEEAIEDIQDRVFLKKDQESWKIFQFDGGQEKLLNEQYKIFSYLLEFCLEENLKDFGFLETNTKIGKVIEIDADKIEKIGTDFVFFYKKELSFEKQDSLFCFSSERGEKKYVSESELLESIIREMLLKFPTKATEKTKISELSTKTVPLKIVIKTVVLLDTSKKKTFAPIIFEKSQIFKTKTKKEYNTCLLETIFNCCPTKEKFESHE